MIQLFPFIVWGILGIAFLAAFAFCAYTKISTILHNKEELELDIHEDEVSFKKEEPYFYVQYTDRVSKAWPVNFHKFCNI